jgi:hypothetical protein
MRVSGGGGSFGPGEGAWGLFSVVVGTMSMSMSCVREGVGGWRRFGDDAGMHGRRRRMKAARKEGLRMRVRVRARAYLGEEVVGLSFSVMLSAVLGTVVLVVEVWVATVVVVAADGEWMPVEVEVEAFSETEDLLAVRREREREWGEGVSDEVVSGTRVSVGCGG